MPYLSHATIKPQASELRLHALKQALESFDCQVFIKRAEKQLEFEVPAEDLSWVLSGFITTLFDAYADVATWSFQFSETPVAEPQEPDVFVGFGKSSKPAVDRAKS